ncbi:HepT-like ribonuclease domain-containing protein [Aeromonas sp. RU39B]|uniref:type VII toxin-antitoxin system HepT family RNase toxin n=1 Tax=Aeromonas sp. RU39B TaxID=1907416 RepID=UPI0015C3CB2C|nr:HepT-like ribonuclease domain-containing protein [Aeromonas sp. RU39B]
MPDITADGDMLGKLASLAGSNPQVQVLWLYGSRAKGTHDPASDWDLAVAFDPVKQDGPLGVVLENRLRPELLALEWQRALGLADGALSVLDINQAPIPLAFAVVAANHLLYSRDEGRRLQEEARIMSRQEIDFSSAAWANYSSNESSDNAYISALRISLSRYQAELSEIRTILAERALSNLEYRAAERTLQVTIEACIGVSKHWARALAGHTPQDAYQAFEILSQRGELAADSLLGWRKIIGLRNALVHDYLNIDPDIIRSVIGQGYSDQLFTFAHQGLDWLAAHLGKLPYV